MNKKKQVLLRADGNSKTGLGHVYRSLALAQYLKDQFDCFFIIQNPLDGLRTEILKSCAGIIELPENGDLLAEAISLAKNINHNAILVLDGYKFDYEYQVSLKSSVNKIVCIDDINAYPFVADVIINHAGSATEAKYDALKETIFCLGTPYALVKKSFLDAIKVDRFAGRDLSNIMICLGGADPNNDTLSVLQKCVTDLKDAHFHIVLGPANQHQHLIEEFIELHALNATIHKNLQEEEMLALMQLCKTAITSPSTICYEYLSIGGLLFIVLIADNQKEIYNFLCDKQLALPFYKCFPNPPAHYLDNIEARLNSYFDGQQQQRYLGLFRYLASENKLTCRVATPEDAMLYFEWANDPGVRENSFNQEAIPLDVHLNWFQKRVIDPAFQFLIFEHNGKPVGQVRFSPETKPGESLIGISIDNAERGNGYASEILLIATNYFHLLYPENKIIAYIKCTNVSSVKGFLKAGFVFIGETLFENAKSYKLFKYGE